MNSRLVAATILLIGATFARAQDPSRDYFTIATTHFRVSFAKPLEPVARRVAADAERAYGQLSRELHPPRGTIDILVTDDFDFSNGSAITHPTNRIIVYAMPPVNDFGLRYTTDWAQLVVTHELTHIFHLDRTRGVWRLAQYAFGRSPFLFPNFYQPSWLIEGLAVYEESRLAGQGRIEGPEHNLLARAAAVDHMFPSIGDASLARPTFPQGNTAYGFGSLFLDYLARTRGDSSIRRLVESSSAQLIPYLIDIPAKRAFGSRFGSAWEDWTRSIAATVDTAAGFNRSLTQLTDDQLVAGFPRWLDDRTLSFTGTTGREVASGYTVNTAGELHRVGRRNGLSPTLRLADGSLLYAQYEYLTPYEYRSDLFTQRSGERAHRLTRGQRLFAPDIRRDDAIVAMQVVEGATRIVRVRRDGNVTPITRAHPDTLWSDPRWSQAGDRIVASRWIRGGVAQIVIIDTLGATRSIVASDRAVLASPSWLPGDSAIIYTAGQGSSNEAYVTFIGSNSRQRVGGATTGFFDPQVRGSLVGGSVLRGGGYRIAVEPLTLDSIRRTALGDSAEDPRTPSLAIDTSAAKSYSALRQLVPRYWVPLAEAGVENGTYRVGGYTEAYDILRRHYLYAELRLPSDNSGVIGAIEYQYRGLGLPLLSGSASQDWTPFPVVSSSDPTQRIGTINRRTRNAEILTTLLRQRVRSSLSFSLGGGLERREYVGEPAGILESVDNTGAFRRADVPIVSLSSTYARYQTPPYAISPEDGFAIAATARERMKSGFSATGKPTTSLVSTLSGFKSLDLPGYAHHVLATRLAGGWADEKTNAAFSVGGVSGGTFDVFPGYTIGEGRRTFPVRGFPPGAMTGVRAVTASIEYRAPLFLAHRTLSTLPTFFQRSAITMFGDYGGAWCPSTLATVICTDPAGNGHLDMASVGGELSANVGMLSWDSPTQLRLGLAVPVHNGPALRGSTRVYFTTGLSF